MIIQALFQQIESQQKLFELYVNLEQMPNVSLKSLALQNFKINITAVCKQISISNMVKLKFLYLNNTQLTSVQDLTHFSLPQVQRIQISNNLLTSAKEIVKMSTSKLKQLDLRNNFIRDHSYLSQMKLDKLKLLLTDENKRENNNVNWVAKVQSKNLQLLGHLKSQAISQKSLEVFKKKYPSIFLVKHKYDRIQ